MTTINITIHKWNIHTSYSPGYSNRLEDVESRNVFSVKMNFQLAQSLKLMLVSIGPYSISSQLGKTYSQFLAELHIYIPTYLHLYRGSFHPLYWSRCKICPRRTSPAAGPASG